jgi:hypothetical protein
VSARDHVIERWDAYIRGWLADASQPRLPAPLDAWFASYSGNVTADAMPEPYMGRWDAAKLVTLGINPGGADLEMQGRDGVFARQIAELGSYSAWAATDPYGQPAWERGHGVNDYRRRRLTFARRWTRDDALPNHDLLDVALYPWHSNKVIATMRPPAAALDEFVWRPLAEIPVPLFFAFGARWAPMCERLGLRQTGRWGPGGKDLGSPVMSRTVITYRLSSEQRIVVCWQQGYAGPPRAEDVERLRAVLAE